MSKRLLLESSTERALRLTLIDGLTTGTSEAIRVQNAQRITFRVVYAAGEASGELIVESAHEEDYSGTWTNEGNSVGSDDATDRVTVSGIVEWIRVRFESDTDLPVTVYMAAEGEY